MKHTSKNLLRIVQRKVWDFCLKDFGSLFGITQRKT